MQHFRFRLFFSFFNMNSKLTDSVQEQEPELDDDLRAFLAETVNYFV